MRKHLSRSSAIESDFNQGDDGISGGLTKAFFPTKLFRKNQQSAFFGECRGDFGAGLSKKRCLFCARSLVNGGQLSAADQFVLREPLVYLGEAMWIERWVE